MRRSVGRFALIAVAACFLLGFCVARATELVRFDAAWWQDLGNEKVVAVQGMTAMYEYAYSMGKDEGFGEGSKSDREFYSAALRRYFKNKPWPPELLNAIKEQNRLQLIELQRASAELSKGLPAIVPGHENDAPKPSFPKTFGTYVHEIDDYYANHVDSTSTSPAFIMNCKALNPPSICKYWSD
jgi:hypothetical protein